jgi:DNA modification methylase
MFIIIMYIIVIIITIIMFIFIMTSTIILNLCRSFSGLLLFQGDVVLDCFAGSGGIVCSAVRLQRVCRGVEILPEWAEYTHKKLEQLSAVSP